MTSPAPFTPDMESAQSPGNMFGDIPTRPMRGMFLILQHRLSNDALMDVNLHSQDPVHL